MSIAQNPLSSVAYRAIQRRWFQECNLPHKKSRKVAVAASELRIVKQYTCHYCSVCKNVMGKVMEDEKKVS